MRKAPGLKKRKKISDGSTFAPCSLSLTNLAPGQSLANLLHKLYSRSILEIEKEM